MKTIKFIATTIEQQQSFQLPAQVQVGTFKVSSTGSLHAWAGRSSSLESTKIQFEIELNPQHIQHLLNLGVVIDLNSVKQQIREGAYRMVKGGAMDNRITTNAQCNLSTLQSIAKYCRYNHLWHVSIDNWHNLTQAGWKPNQAQPLTMPNSVLEHFNRIEAIRKEVRKKFSRSASNYALVCHTKNSAKA